MLALTALAVLPTGRALNITSAASAYEGITSYPQLSIVARVARSDPQLREYLSQPGRVFTGFVPADNATEALLQRIGRLAGAALTNKTFVRAVFDYMVVPGKAWSVEELRRAAPTELKTNQDGETLNVTKDQQAPFGIRVNGFRILTADTATKDGKAVLHILDGVPVPPSQRPQLDAWLSGSLGGGAGGAGVDAGQGAAGARVADAGAPAPAAAGAGAPAASPSTGAAGSSGPGAGAMLLAAAAAAAALAIA